jgi:hypothetical protein
MTIENVPAYAARKRDRFGGYIYLPPSLSRWREDGRAGKGNLIDSALFAFLLVVALWLLEPIENLVKFVKQSLVLARHRTSYHFATHKS